MATSAGPPDSDDPEPALGGPNHVEIIGKIESGNRRKGASVLENGHKPFMTSSASCGKARKSAKTITETLIAAGYSEPLAAGLVDATLAEVAREKEAAPRPGLAPNQIVVNGTLGTNQGRRCAGSLRCLPERRPVSS